MTGHQDKPENSVSTGDPASTDAKAGRVTGLSVEERMALGKAARARVPRASHAAWKPPAKRADPVALLEEQARSRIPELVPLRYARMLASRFAFFRGGAAIMAADLAGTPQSGLHAQICGDAHLANFGGFASPEGDLVFDINDFDETLPGPWEWDLKRLAASIEIAGQDRGFVAGVRQEAVMAMVGEYRRAMGEFAAMSNLDLWYSLLDEASILKRWGRPLPGGETGNPQPDGPLDPTRDNLRGLEKLTHLVNGRPRIISRPPLLVPLDELLPEAERERFEQTIKDYMNSYARTLNADRRLLVESYRYADLARKVMGVGSVGTEVWLMLLLGRDDRDALFLQLKEAQASVLEAYLGPSKYTYHGERVVEGQRVMQAAGDNLLGWERITEPGGATRDFYVRQQWDWKVSPPIESMAPPELAFYGQVCGWVLARAHARSGDRIAIAAYIGASDILDLAIADFAAAYAVQNELDYQALQAAAKSGRIKTA
jgi:uncharacterized protein (DUF2252 family)